ncbi:hypothetical protein AAV94_09635 [Lampropedia cohaerens]|uniref:Sigma-54 factor interaction domain-containing protein n=1 Tax=Lampropedia cohaerens TaxID=1610491 RepID=A0A0U1PYR5_9BURK|nr:helix-turn-helix domain-containing protein [Lampropedia cohaerens]KKW67611.1 hypothetical protein AAV94_09635 [Lampropedia cohaerens]
MYAHFSELAAQKYGMPKKAPDTACLAWMEAHDWPGNVRELAHFAEREVLGVSNGAIAQEPAGDLSLPARVEQFEARQIRDALARHKGDVKATLQELGIPRKTFYDKLQRHGIQRSDFMA